MHGDVLRYDHLRQHPRGAAVVIRGNRGRAAVRLRQVVAGDLVPLRQGGRVGVRAGGLHGQLQQAGLPGKYLYAADLHRFKAFLSGIQLVNGIGQLLVVFIQRKLGGRGVDQHRGAVAVFIGEKLGQNVARRVGEGDPHLGAGQRAAGQRLNMNASG